LNEYEIELSPSLITVSHWVSVWVCHWTISITLTNMDMSIASNNSVGVSIAYSKISSS